MTIRSKVVAHKGVFVKTTLKNADVQKANQFCWFTSAKMCYFVVFIESNQRKLPNQNLGFVKAGHKL